MLGFCFWRHGRTGEVGVEFFRILGLEMLGVLVLDSRRTGESASVTYLSASKQSAGLF